MAKNKMNGLDWIAIILLLVGGLNWGFVGLFDFNLVTYLFGDKTLIATIVYVLVGASAAYSVFKLFKK